MRRDLSPLAAAQGSVTEQPQAAAQGATLQGGVGSGAATVILQSPTALSGKIEKNKSGQDRAGDLQRPMLTP